MIDTNSDNRDRRPDHGVLIRVEDGSLPGPLQVLLSSAVDRAECAYFFDWFADDDALVHFIYGNQGPMFMDDAQPFRNPDGSISIACEGERDIHDRIFGSWEDGPAYIAQRDKEAKDKAVAAMLCAPKTDKPVLLQILDAAANEAAEHELFELASEIANLSVEAAKELVGR